MKKNILITGGAGFIGSSLALKLITKGYKVTVLDNLSPQIHGEDGKKSELFLKIRDKVNFVKGDVINSDDWRKALKEQDVVVHLAAETGTGQSMYEINKYIDVNIKGTSNLLDILTNEEHQVKKIVVAASRAICGEGMYECSKHGIVYPTERTDEDMKKGDFEVKCPTCHENVKLLATTEETKIHPTSIYGITKQMQEDMCMVVGKSLGIPVVSYRYQNVYGPGQSLKNPYTGIISIFSTIIKNNNGINIFEDGKESRDFVYIDDIVEATVLGIEKDEANFESFNVGTGVCTNVIEVANTLKSKYESNTEISISGNYRLGDIRHNYADLTKINDKLGFVPSIDFETGIGRFVDWVNQQEVVEDNYEKSIAEMKEKGLYK
ncbi:epimerase [Carnobacterium maltaromaticum]|uniref:SDR family NAD(P)-dependent oxidoreductase n=1 Tax=Carnobacterium maltaromaticum TaxID=2751 RepID=UPI000C77EB0B|nr:SDR family NAD(P)-dependent oxidoreductase [Carnobacterium maltaromaticum]PLS36911.1 epimerase [Carnobacterium maltaromaticum]PLS37726.1 epimerase [Carnobacterium maltaromaticum]PLS39667.1 epimerase [Carnobacterium maltaromaticum]PLS44423.1 epimerase [Carnobacterium maltaromaticum]PLS46457.1 epimerase [Carnobacterium maltaromaticum]